MSVSFFSEEYIIITFLALIYEDFSTSIVYLYRFLLPFRIFLVTNLLVTNLQLSFYYQLALNCLCSLISYIIINQLTKIKFYKRQDQIYQSYLHKVITLYCTNMYTNYLESRIIQGYGPAIRCLNKRVVIDTGHP